MTSHALDAPFTPEIEARVQELLQRPYRKVISGDADEGYLIEVPDLPGCMTAAATLDQAVSQLPEAMALWLGVALERGEPIPEPGQRSGGPDLGSYSGRLLVRMPKTLHRRLIERADQEGVSANQLAVALLSRAL